MQPNVKMFISRKIHIERINLRRYYGTDSFYDELTLQIITVIGQIKIF